MLLGGNKYLVILFLLISALINVIGAANILVIFPYHTRSHTIMGSALVKGLLNKGHHVTMITHFPEKEKPQNYSEIYVKTTMMDAVGMKGSADRFFEEDSSSLLDRLNVVLDFFFKAGAATCDMMLAEEGVTKLIHDKDAQFDLVIMETFLNECFLGFVHKFKAPLIQASTFSGTLYMGEWFGTSQPYSYVPGAFISSRNKMSFWDRLFNTVGALLMKALRNLYLNGQDVIVKKHFRFLEDLPTISEMEYNTSVLLINDHFTLSSVKPLMPGMVQVGGMHVNLPKELPQDLQRFMDDAPNGVIYFSLGSNLKGVNMPVAQREALLEAFSQLKQKVLWKWEDDVLPGQPDNVKLGKWLPQNDILAHPNIRLFITHGGLLSTQEAVLRGVPLLGLPIFADQVANMKGAESLGFGIMLDFRKNLTAESVKWAITEVLENPRYMENAQRISRVSRDQPMSPLDQAVYWTEYVIRHKGAPHMRSVARDLPWYQYFLLDVIAVLILIPLIAVLILFYALRAVFKKCCKNKTLYKSKKRN